jgi:hypothetical protein
MRPVVNRLEEAYGSQVKFLYLDANGDGKEAFQVGRFPGHPVVVLLKADGKEAWRRVGIVAYGDIEAEIVDVLQ